MNDLDLKRFAAAYRKTYRPSAERIAQIEKIVLRRPSMHAGRWTLIMGAALAAGLTLWFLTAPRTGERLANTPEVGEASYARQTESTVHAPTSDPTPSQSATLEPAPPSSAPPTTAPTPRRPRPHTGPPAPTPQAPVAPAPEDHAGLLRRAEDALPHDPSAALALVHEHGRRFPDSPLTLERDALGVLARCALGSSAERLREHERFMQAHHENPYSARVRAACRP